MLISNHQLSAKQLKSLDGLSNDCKKFDGNTIPLYKHLLRNNRTDSFNFLYYQNKQLTGFLSAFFFYEKTCEITVMVNPTLRRQGIASRLIKAALPFIQAQSIKTIIFSTPNNVNNHWLPSKRLCYQGSEYHMLWQQTALTIKKSPLLIRPATTSDLPALCSIDNACFSTNPSDMSERFYHLLHDPSYTLFMAEKEGRPVGKAHIHWQKNSGRLTDIAVLPHFQGHGFGSELITHCIHHCLSAHRMNIYLDVETKNQQALRLYIRLGFLVTNAYEFWSIPIEYVSEQ